MEASLFVPSGTMGNLLSVLCHCSEHGSEFIVGDNAHLFIYEQGASGLGRRRALAELHACALT